MITSLVFDFSRVLLFANDNSYVGGLNNLHKQLMNDPEYNLLDHFYLNTELLEYLQQLKPKYSLFLYTSELIQNAPEIRPTLEAVFSRIYSSMDMGFNKKDSEGYKALAAEIKKAPEEILFIDDTLSNIEAANQAGFQTIHYNNNSSLITELNQILDNKG